ncbi:MAG: hypothetical protein ACOZAA_07645 [Pseudomonadota bacterium]
MKNLTLRIDEKVLAAARKRAALEGTTVAKVVREFLRDYAAAHLPESAAAERARGELVTLAEQSTSRPPADWKWNRDEIYEERMRRLRDRHSDAPGFAEPPPPYEDQAMLERTANRPPTLEEMTTDSGAPPVPGHDEWFRRQVQKALDDKKSGKATYFDFDEVAAEFGFNAR